MEIIQKLAIVDWLALASVCAIIALAFGSESGFLAERKREAAAAMIGLAGLFAVMLVTSDAEDSVFFSGLTEEQPKPRERKPKADEDGPKTEPNQAHERDSSGPGDGDGGQGKEIKLTLAAGPGMNNGRGGLGGRFLAGLLVRQDGLFGRLAFGSSDDLGVFGLIRDRRPLAGFIAV